MVVSCHDECHQTIDISRGVGIDELDMLGKWNPLTSRNRAVWAERSNRDNLTNFSKNAGRNTTTHLQMVPFLASSGLAE
jgi:hypothetical protein